MSGRAFSAEQRFYTSQFGRFMSADRFKRAASVYDSGSWNKYLYTSGDPVNRVDPTGEASSCTDDDCDESGDPGDTVCDSNGSNCYDSITVNGGDDDGGGGDDGIPSAGLIASVNVTCPPSCGMNSGTNMISPISGEPPAQPSA